MAIYAFYNGPMPTTAALAPVTTSTSLKTMLQVKLNTGVKGKIIAWAASFDASAAATPGKVELIETGTVFGTVTAYVAADIVKWADPNEQDPTTWAVSVGTSASGYTCTSEGTITASRLFDAASMPPTGFYYYQFPLGREPMVNGAAALRIRAHFAAAVNMICYVIIEV